MESIIGNISSNTESHNLKQLLLNGQQDSIREHQQLLKSTNLLELEEIADKYGVYKNCNRDELIDKLLRVFRKQNELEVEKIISIDNLSITEKLDKASIELVFQMT